MQVFYILLRDTVIWTQCTIIVLYSYMVSKFTLSVRITILNTAGVLVLILCMSNRTISYVKISLFV